MKKILTLICTLLCANVLLAQDIFLVGQLYYYTTSSNEVCVLCYNSSNTPTDLVIPSTVTYQGTTYSVTTIGGGAFCMYYNEGGQGGYWIDSPCGTLTSVVIPNSVTTIGNSAFLGCSNLTSVTIPNSVTSIENSAFKNCSSLTFVTCLRSNSPSLENGLVFAGTPNYKTLTIPCGYESEYTDWQNATTWLSIDCFVIIGSRFTIGDLTYAVTSETEVKVYACTESATSVVIPETVTYQGTTYSVTSIGDDAFIGCSSLTSITIGNSVTSIGEEAFWGCSSLTSVTIPNSVTYIGGVAFYACSGLTSITIPNSVTSIGGAAFSYCSSLTSVTLSNNITELPCSDYGYCMGFFEGCSGLTSITIPNSVTSIGDNAFRDCSSLTSMTIEMNNVWDFGNIGLDSTLQNLTLGENVTSIASGAFNNYPFLQNVTCLATNPPTLADNTVFPNPNIATLTVPCGTLEVYNSSDWNIFFADRIEEDCEDNTGLEDAEFAELSVYPNPTRGKVTFNQAIEKIEVIDLSGKTLQTYENANEINIEALPAGVYHLRMTIEDKTTTRKIIKE